MAWWVPVAMAAASMAAEQDKADKNRKAQLPIEMAKAKYSGWTGMQPGMIKPADIIGAGLQGAGAGMAMNQSMDNAKNQNAYLEAMKAYMNRGTSDSSAWGQAGPVSGQNSAM